MVCTVYVSGVSPYFFLVVIEFIAPDLTLNFVLFSRQAGQLDFISEISYWFDTCGYGFIQANINEKLSIS